MAFKESKLYCGFCKKSEDEVKQLFSGGKTFVCESCIKVAFNTNNNNENRKLIKHHLLKRDN